MVIRCWCSFNLIFSIFYQNHDFRFCTDDLDNITRNISIGFRFNWNFATAFGFTASFHPQLDWNETSTFIWNWIEQLTAYWKGHESIITATYVNWINLNVSLRSVTIKCSSIKMRRGFQEQFDNQTIHVFRYFFPQPSSINLAKLPQHYS